MEQISLETLFERRHDFPDRGAQSRYSRLVGIDEAKSRLVKLLSILVNPEGPKRWAVKHHGGAPLLLDYLTRRPPLVLLSGDVGTGKTELAETVGDAVARAEKIDVTLFPMSLSTRGKGQVGEMTMLISAAFDAVIDHAKRSARPGAKAATASILLIDEGDALTQSRESSQMHHEDRAGVNAFIRGIDRLAATQLPVAVLLCTNRVSSIDPAVLRRAADIFEFGRPVDEQRRAVLEGPLHEAGFSAKQIDQFVVMTGVGKGRAIGFTYSDLTQRLLPTLVLDAYPEAAIRFDRALEVLDTIAPTPAFKSD